MGVRVCRCDFFVTRRQSPPRAFDERDARVVPVSLFRADDGRAVSRSVRRVRVRLGEAARARGGSVVRGMDGSNGDGGVDFNDLNLVLSEFGDRGDHLAGDLDLDGKVGFPDLAKVLSNMGNTGEND